MLFVFCYLFTNKFSRKDRFLKFTLKLSQPVFVKCFLTFARFESHVSYKLVSLKKACIYRVESGK